MRVNTTVLVIMSALVWTSCMNESWIKVKKIDSDYSVHGMPIFFETDLVLLKLEKANVIKYLEEKVANDEYTERVPLLDFLKVNSDTLRISADTVFSTYLDTLPKSDYELGKKGDTVVRMMDYRDERNYYSETLGWVAHEFLIEGKCEILSKPKMIKVKSYSYELHHVPVNSEYTVFKFENDTVFFGRLLSLGL